jgi:hypothetical protein
MVKCDVKNAENGMLKVGKWYVEGGKVSFVEVGMGVSFAGKRVGWQSTVGSFWIR